MKIIKYLLFLCLFISCKTKNITLDIDNTQGAYIGKAKIYLNNHYFECNSCQEYLPVYQPLFLYKIPQNHGDYISELDEYIGDRTGQLVDGKQSGQWISRRDFDYDSLSYSKKRKYIYREEYFKKGLRDSIYKIYNKDGEIIYSTYFKNGNGLEKDFHKNGKLYYEMQIKDGYFTDTLRIYNDNGNLVEKLLYIKDSLVYQQKL